jgi:hypothetical protein
MRVWAHAVFAAVLVGSLASRERSVEAPIDDASFETVVLSVGRSQGLDFREYRTSDAGGRRTIVFNAPGCSGPMLVTWRPATFEDEAATESAPGQDDRLQYVYFDQKWNRPNRWAVSLQRMKYSLLAMLGRTDYATSNFVLQVEAPRDCPAAERVDWRPAWSRTYPTPS